MNLNLGNSFKMISIIMKALQANFDFIYKHIHTTSYTDRFSNIHTMGYDKTKNFIHENRKNVTKLILRLIKEEFLSHYPHASGKKLKY